MKHAPGIAVAALALAVAGCAAEPAAESQAAASYFDTSGRDDVLGGGARRIPITTPRGPFSVWTKRVGNHPRLKVLLLHGGPGSTHEYFEAFDSYLPAAGVEYYYYDQLGSGHSDQPDAPDLWEIPRFVDEVEQVRQALGLGRDNLVLLGHSWVGILAIEYALAHQQHLKGLVVSNMMSSIPQYNRYAREVLMPAMDQTALGEILDLEARRAFADPRYEELLMEHFYVHHVLRLPAAQWPDPVVRGLAHINKAIYVPMQGPSEMGASGKLENWDRSGDLSLLTVPTLVIGAGHDTMDPAHMEWMAAQIPRARYLLCPQGSHMAMYDDQQVYFDGLIRFLRDLDAGRFDTGGAALSGGDPGVNSRLDKSSSGWHSSARPAHPSRGRRAGNRGSGMESTIMAFGGLVLGWTLERLQRHYRDRWQERRRRLRLRRLIGPRDE